MNLATQDADAPWGRNVEAILDDGDAAIFRPARRYRNDAYHEDEHNPALIAPLTVVYAQALGRAWVHRFRSGTAWGLGEGQREALERLEWVSHGRSSGPSTAPTPSC